MLANSVTERKEASDLAPRNFFFFFLRFLSRVALF